MTAAMPGPVVRVLPDEDALAAATADLFRRAATEAVAAKGRFTVALSGGRTPRPAFARLAGDPAFRTSVPWSKVRVFWTDERMVPPDDPRSNFGMARDTFISRLPIADTQVTRVRGELGDAALAAAEYSQALTASFGLTAGDWPRFDLVLLGLGTDGHTASLFPGTPAASERARIALAVARPAPDVDRVSLTLPVLNHAALLAFIVSGADKAAMLARVLDAGRDTGERLPASLVRPVTGELVWLVDQAAAGAGRSSGGGTR